MARHLVERGCRTDILLLSALGDLRRVRESLDAAPDGVNVVVSDAFFPRRNPRAGGTIYQWTLGRGKTPHALAREFGHEAVLQLLLERTPADLKLAIACELGDAKLVAQLKGGGAVPAVSPALQGKIVQAAIDNQADAVRLLLESGWSSASPAHHGATLLHWAAFHGNVEMVRLLLQRSPDLEARDADFRGTPLDWALHGSEHGWHRATGDYPGVVELLLAAGARIPDGQRGTPEVRAALGRRKS